MYFVIGLFLLIFSGADKSIQNDDLLACITKYDAKWGEDCSQCKYMNDTYTVFFKNNCDQILDVKCAVQENDLYWKTYTFLNVEPERTFTAYACRGTGKYQYWVKLSGDRSIELPSDDVINHRED
ncbi:MAG: hypothetical protein HKN22_05800 [Bacteroidia bacterium]|nr:hypothetical protein [Bacteroidia bacterium]